MNRPASSKFVPALPNDDDIDTQTNSASPNSVKIYDGVAECTMNDADTIKNVKIRAKDLAQEKLLNKLADCVDGFLRDRLLTFPDDEILAIVNEIYHITDVKYNTFDSDDNLMVRATVLAQIDDNDIMNCLVRFFKERNELKSQNEALRKENGTLSNLCGEIDALKNQNESLRRGNESLRKENESLRKENYNLKRKIDELTPKVISERAVYLAEKKFRDAYSLYTRTYYHDAIKRLNEAIELNPNYVEAYKFRSMAYAMIGEDEKADADRAKADELFVKG